MMANITEISKSTQFKSGAKAVESGRKGGIASGAAKREKKDMAYFARVMLDEIIHDKKGVEIPTRYAMLKSVLKRVLKDGDVNAFKTITAQAGEQPKEANGNIVIVNNFTGISHEAADALNNIDEL
jgi:hypothetical protein